MLSPAPNVKFSARHPFLHCFKNFSYVLHFLFVAYHVFHDRIPRLVNGTKSQCRWGVVVYTWITAEMIFSSPLLFPLAPRKPLSTPRLHFLRFPWWYRPKLYRCFHHLDSSFRITLAPVSSLQTVIHRSPYVQSSFSFRKVLSFTFSQAIFLFWMSLTGFAFVVPL